jgi:hypothetical protein
MRAFFGVVALLTVAAVPVAPNFSADTPVRDLVAALGGPAVPARDAEAV